MNRSLKLPLLVALALGSGQALAMDLGQIQVKSALGQPLLAEIPVQQATAAELQQLNVQLASGDASGGIPLHFAVVEGANGHKVIRITSETVVNDPFLDLLVEVHGGTGKTVREFTILLDPPGSSPVPQPSRPRAGHAMQPAAAAPKPRTSAPVVAGQWRVESGQNLSTVARKVAPAGVDINQMMLALKQANPDAFYRDNINALKAGAVLRIPSKVEAEAVAMAAAAEEVRRENGDWRNGPIGNAPTSVADAGTRAGTSSSPTATKANAGDHLALVPAKQGGKSATDNSGALRQDLQRTEESLANLQQQSADLKSRLKDLSDLNSKNQRLLALKDNEIAELQQKLAAARKSAGMPAEAKPAAAATAETVVAKAGQAKPAAAVPAPAASAPASSATAAKPAAAPAGAATAPVANPVASPAKAEPAKHEPAKTAPVKPAAIKPAPVSEEPWYTQLWVQALGGAVVLLLLLGWLLGRRKAKPAALPKSAPSLADRFGGELPMDDTHDDVDQNLLLDQLAEHPDDIGLHLELVSLYYGRRDIEHFEAAAEAMHAHVTDPQQEEWQQVVRMGEDLVPAHPLFADHGSMVADEHEARHGFDIDQYAAEPPAPSAPPPMPASPVTVSEYNFNFDLTPSHERHAEDAKPAAQPVVDEDATVIRGSGEAKPDWHFDEEPETQLQPAGHDIEPREFSDDPVDTKLDLARAYLDMGDPEGARAMLEEVLHEGSQVQRDVAKRLLDDLH